MNHLKIPVRRLISATIDFFIAFIPTWFALDRYGASLGDFFVEMVFFINLCIITVVIPLLGSGKTVGDALTRIEMISISETPVEKTILVIRNATYALFISFIISQKDDLLSMSLITISVLGSYLMMFSQKNKYKEYLSSLDYIFKTKFRVISIKTN